MTMNLEKIAYDDLLTYLKTYNIAPKDSLTFLLNFELELAKNGVITRKIPTISIASNSTT